MKILMIRYSSLGDVVLATGAVHAVLRAIPESDITFVTKPAYEPLLRNLHEQVKVPLLDAIRPLYSAWSMLRGDRYDWIVDLHGSIRSLCLSQALRSKRQTRVHKNSRRRRAMVRSKRGLDRPLSTLMVNHAALAPLGISGDPCRPRLRLSANEASEAAAIASGPLALAIGWGAKWPAKAVPAEVFATLLQHIPAGEISRIVIFAEPSAQEAAQAFSRTLNSDTDGRRSEVVASSNWRHIMTRLAACAAYVGADSGLLHVADALGVPSIGLFGPTHPSLGFPPSGEESRAFHAGTWCSPCHRHGADPCFRERRYCFDEINLSAVAATIRNATVRKVSETN